MKRAAVFSGGGALGAFQRGAHRGLVERGITFDVIAGNSVGALNGCMIAAGKENELDEVWQTVRNEDIYDKAQTIPEEVIDDVLRVLTKDCVSVTEVYDVISPASTSFWSNAPLEALINRHISFDEMKIPVRIAVTALYEGQYHSLKSEWFKILPENARRTEWNKMVLASTAQPVIWPVVPSLELGHIGLSLHHLCDGGVMNVSPVWDVLDDEPDEIWIFNCANTRINGFVGNSKTVVERLMRTLSLVLMDNYQSDVQTFMAVMTLAKQYGGITWQGRYIKPTDTFLVEPVIDLGDSMEFAWEPYGRMRYEHGYGMVQR